MPEFCCICSQAFPPEEAALSEKVVFGRVQKDCCGRAMCGDCIQSNERYETYCPYCQISSVPSSLPQGLKEPPSYAGSVNRAPPPPPYSSKDVQQLVDIDRKGPVEYDEKTEKVDTLHFLDHEHDTITSLSLRYGVPASALRSKNSIASDHLLQGRKTILIPGEYYTKGESLSPRPVDGEEEELRKSKIRRFMTTCKVHDYNVAVIYLERADYDLQLAVEAHFADDQWERETSRRR